MDFARGFRAKNNQSRIKHLRGGGIHAFPENQLIIRIPDSRVLRVIARSVLLAFAIVTFPWLGSFIGTRPIVSDTGFGSSDPIDTAQIFRDLTTEGLLKSGDKALFVSGGDDNNNNKASHIIPQILDENEMDLISESDLERQSLIPDAAFDFAFASGFRAVEFIDRTLKIGGIAAIQLSDDPSNAFRKPSNYKIVYLRRFESTIVAMRKTGLADISTNSPAVRRLCALVSEAKKAALNGLEDVLLEPPRAASVQSNNYLKGTKYLPDLLGDSLDGYPRRIFIDVGLPGTSAGSPEWFEQNYPTRNRDFKIYKIETVSEESSSKAVPQVGMSEWLRKNVREDEYVVMKAEAEEVEEMMSSKAICLVDELFLECKHQWQDGKNKNNRRAYWECLALYGRLKDEGIAVHQWWG